MAFIRDGALDALLADIRDNTTTLHICSSEPTNYAGVTGSTLGNKATPSIAAPSDRTPNGREVVISAITDGTVDGTGTATSWALTSGSVLYAAGSLSSSQAVTSGNTFTLTSYTIGVPDAT